VPDINFLEWDGLLRIVFNRKHKTVGAIFRQRDVVEMLRANYNAFLSLSGSAAPPLQTEEETKERLIAALADAQMAESRSAALDVDDFLMMLATFNRHGFHFA
jgi:18S rRNA (adenine1779-N6/adenine1780-N6)-dimethyltransferase